VKRLEFLMVILFFAVFSFVSCGDDTGKKTSSDSDVDSDTVSDADEVSDEEVIVPICKTPGDGPYELKFTDITEEIGFKGLDVLGSQITVADIDGDKWPDVYTTLSSKLREDPAAPTGLYRLLKNVKGKSFEDVTFTSGLFKNKEGTNGLASSYVVFADMDNDGDMDAFNVVYVDKSTFALDDYMEDYSRIYINNGDGTFKPGPAYNFSLMVYEAFAGVSFLDYNRDGILDMFIGRHYNEYGVLESCEQDTLLQGLGGGKFKDITEGSGLETVKVTDESLASGKNHKATWGVAACDVDGDGNQDIMTTTYGRSFNMFYRNKGDGSFEDLSIPSNFASDALVDYNDDQYFACYCADAANKDTDYCKDAQTPKISCDSIGTSGWTPGFSDQPHRLGGNSSGTLCGDFDGDGDMDLFAIELAHWHIGASSDKSQLLMNDGFPQVPFRRVAEADSGITRSRAGSWNDGDLGGVTADFDNDGKLDIFVLSSDYDGTKSLLYQQQSDGKFKETGKNAGAQIPRAHGGALIDIDRDGDYDLIVGVSMMRWSTTDGDGAKKPEKQWVTVLRNDTGSDANRVMIDLIGTKANRSAIGAKIIVKAGGKQFVREVQSSYGLTGFQNDSLQIIGIGNLCEVEEVEIQWPDADKTVTKYTEVYPNYVLEINQETGLKHHKIEEYFLKE